MPHGRTRLPYQGLNFSFYNTILFMVVWSAHLVLYPQLAKRLREGRINGLRVSTDEGQTKRKLLVFQRPLEL